MSAAYVFDLIHDRVELWIHYAPEFPQSADLLRRLVASDLQCLHEHCVREDCELRVTVVVVQKVHPLLPENSRGVEDVILVYEVDTCNITGIYANCRFLCKPS